MTTIACDGKTMAGDGRTTREGFICNDETEKVVRAEDGSLIGTCGTASVGLEFIKWWEAGHKGKWEMGREANALVLTPEGRLIFYGDCGFGNESPAPQAIGSGSPYAMGALLAGATAAEAVRIACKLDPASGGKITQLRPE